MKKMILILCWMLAAKQGMARRLDLSILKDPSLALPDPNASLAERQLAFEKLSIQEIDGDRALVAGKAYKKRELEGLYSQASARKALLALRKSESSDGGLPIVTGATAGGGAVAGVAVGAILWWVSGFYGVPPDKSSWGFDFGSLNYDPNHRTATNFAPCVVTGVSLGLVAAGIEYLVITRHAKSSFENSTRLYNQSLEEKLQLEVVPLPGGAKAGASLRF